MAEYTLRRAQRRDLAHAAHVVVVAFSGNEIGRAVNMTDDGTSWAMTLFQTRKRFVNPACRQLVVEETTTGKIVGLATWEMQGDNNPARKQWMSEAKEWWWPFEHALLAIEGFYGKRTTWSSLDFAALDEYAKESETHALVIPENSLELHTLAVLPEYQGKGIGKLMLQWGIDLADSLTIPAWLESSVAGKAVYEKMGYKVVKHSVVAKGRPGREFEMPIMMRPVPTFASTAASQSATDASQSVAAAHQSTSRTSTTSTETTSSTKETMATEAVTREETVVLTSTSEREKKLEQAMQVLTSEGDASGTLM